MWVLLEVCSDWNVSVWVCVLQHPPASLLKTISHFIKPFIYTNTRVCILTPATGIHSSLSYRHKNISFYLLLWCQEQQNSVCFYQDGSLDLPMTSGPFVWHCMWWLLVSASISYQVLVRCCQSIQWNLFLSVWAVKPEGPQHPTWAHTWSGLIKPTCKSCHFESDSVLTRQSVDTSISWGLPSFSCKFWV